MVVLRFPAGINSKQKSRRAIKARRLDKNSVTPDFLFAGANRIIVSDLWTRNRPFQRLESLPRRIRPSFEANPPDSEFVPALLGGLFLSALLELDTPNS